MKGMGEHEIGEVLQSFIPGGLPSALLSVQFSFPVLKADDTSRYVCIVFCTEHLEMLRTEKK